MPQGFGVTVVGECCMHPKFIHQSPLIHIGTGSGNGTLECYLDEAFRLDGLRVLIGWGNWETAHIVKRLGLRMQIPRGSCIRAVWWPVLVTPGW